MTWRFSIANLFELSSSLGAAKYFPQEQVLSNTFIIFFRPLHEAVENGFVEIVRLLLAYGADPFLATYSGLTPLSLAIDDVTVALLKNQLADIKGEATIPWSFIGPASLFGVYLTMKTLCILDLKVFSELQTDQSG